MNKTTIKKNELVLISNNIEKTIERFGGCPGMDNLEGKICKVEKVNIKTKWVIIQGYTFDIDDISPFTKKQLSENIFHFDVSNLSS